MLIVPTGFLSDYSRRRLGAEPPDGCTGANSRIGVQRLLLRAQRTSQRAGDVTAVTSHRSNVVNSTRQRSSSRINVFNCPLLGFPTAAWLRAVRRSTCPASVVAS